MCFCILVINNYIMISYPRFINSKVIKQHEQKINDERNLTMSFTKIILADGSGTEMIKNH